MHFNYLFFCRNVFLFRFTILNDVLNNFRRINSFKPYILISRNIKCLFIQKQRNIKLAFFKQSPESIRINTDRLSFRQHMSQTRKTFYKILISSVISIFLSCTTIQKLKISILTVCKSKAPFCAILNFNMHIIRICYI